MSMFRVTYLSNFSLEDIVMRNSLNKDKIEKYLIVINKLLEIETDTATINLNNKNVDPWTLEDRSDRNHKPEAEIMLTYENEAKTQEMQVICSKIGHE